MKSTITNQVPKQGVLLLTVIFYFLFSQFGWGQTVSIEGGSTYPTISAALTASVNGDVILINGLHTESISFNKNITLRGTNPVTDIIQAAAAPGIGGIGLRVITVNPTAGNVTIENLTIRHGNANVNGGGISADRITGLITLRNVIVANNFTTNNGGGISFTGSNALLINCTVQNNSATLDGGALLAAPNNSSLMSNDVTIKQSLINSNTARNGGGIYINGNTTFGNDYEIDVNIENTTIANNAATSATGGFGGGSIFSNSALWTTNAGGDGTSGNVTLQLVHATVYNNTHLAPIKSGIVFNNVALTYFSAYNSIIVAANDIAIRAINFANASTFNVVNCILGGLNAADGPFLDAAARNNTRGRTAANAGLSTSLASLGGTTQVLPIAAGPTFSGVNWCTATTGITLPTVDQRGFTRQGTPDAGAFELFSTTWNSSLTWTNGAPNNLYTDAIIEAPYTSSLNGGGFFASKLTITPTGSLTLSSGHNIRTENEVFNNSTLGADGFIIENNANLRQNNGAAPNSGSIKIIRNSNPLLRFDYTLWSSPVKNQNLLTFSPLTLDNRFYNYNSSLNIYSEVVPSSSNFLDGRGYLIRMPNNHPTTTPTIWPGVFTGVPNNGEINVPLVTNIDEGKRYNLVGNPYPSPLNIANFVAGNSGKITGTLWFWRKTNSTTTTTVYPTWNGGTWTGNSEPFGDPNPDPTVIRTGQGFFVQAVASPPGPLVFNNFMRQLENTNQFFKAAAFEFDDEVPEVEVEKHRIWLHLTNSAGYAYEQAISYIDGGTSAVDLYDAQSINAGEILFNSIIPESSKQYVIQSRPLPFDSNDIIPLAIKLTNPASYSISIAGKDGLFTDGSQAIYLKDNYTNTLFDLNQGSYQFNGTNGVFNDRFELRFSSGTLSTPEPIGNANQVVVYQDNENQLVINSYLDAIKAVMVFDLSGRLLHSNNLINTSTYKTSLNAISNQVLLVQIENVNGVVVTKKIIR